MAVSIAKPALVLTDKLVLIAGTHNGIQYASDEVRKLYKVYVQIERKPKETRTMDETHAFDIHCGDDEDHKDSSGTWVGDAEGVYFSEKDQGIGFHKLNIVDEAFAKKIQYQKARGKASFGISPRLNVLRVGALAKDILPKNISIVLTPAGGEQLMLSKVQELEDEREVRQDTVQEITLSDIKSLGGGGFTEMEGQEIIAEVGKLIDNKLTAFKKAEDEAKMSSELLEMKKKCDALETERLKLSEELQKKKKDEEELANKDNKDDKDKEKDKELQKKVDKKDEDKMQKDKKKDEEDEDEEMQKDKKKYKYYGALSARDSLLKNFRLTPDLAQLDAVSVNRVAEDILNATKVFDSQFTLEQAQRGIVELQTILANLPGSKKEEKQLMDKLETTLSANITGELKGLLQDKISSGASTSRRKGLIPGGVSERREATLSEQQNTQGNQSNSPQTASDIASEITNLFCAGLGL